MRTTLCLILVVFFLPAQATDIAQHPWRLCALYPHIKDSYWLSINYGMVRQAELRNVNLRVAEAGGYNQQLQQLLQLQDCLDWQADAILLGAVSDTALSQQLSSGSESTPVFGLVNHLSYPDSAGQVGVNWYNMGSNLGQWLARRHPAGSSQVTLAWLPGPEQHGGTPQAEQGLADALAESAVRIVWRDYGDNDRSKQRQLIQQTLKEFPQLDYLAGGAVMAEVAINELSSLPTSAKRPVLISNYLSHGVYRGLLRGKIAIANSDQMVLQGQMAIDQAIEYLEHNRTHQHWAPEILQMKSGNIDTGSSLSPAGFTPVYEVSSPANR